MNTWEQNQLTSGLDPNKQPSRKTKRINALVILALVVMLAAVAWLLSR